ncbi:MAG: DUF975 family protein [Oscillospiraceae bacterium]|nr:DUF975 family protein [Oscillospiraceae bacterium]
MEYQDYMDRAYLKGLAKQKIKGKIGILFVIAVLIAAISSIAAGLLSIIPVAGPIISVIVITPAFALSIMRVYLNVVADQELKITDAFSGFDDFWAAFKVQFLTGLFTFLWSLLFIIPGIIKAYSYSMSMYILAENKGMPALECIQQSKDMTDGHKMELFILYLSFFGWALLGAITFGIAYIWIMPYIQATQANAYNVLKAKYHGQIPTN